MPLILPGNVGSATATTGYDVANSLRFNSGSSDHLNRTTSSGNRLKWTWSAWVKKTKNGADEDLFSGYHNSSNFTRIQIGDTGVINFINKTSGSQNGKLESNRLFRDNSAWYHFVIVWDSGNATAANRMRIYVNGVEETSFQSDTQPSQDQVSHVNQDSKTNYVGTFDGSGTFFNGYMAEVVLVDGQALDPTSFGEFDSDSPTIWKPKNVSGLTFGTNGFYLDFENSSSLGADVSGQGNNFTVNNLTSVDQSTDTCTNNFATLNPLYTNDGAITYSEGNLKAVAGSGSSSWTTRYAFSNIGVSAGRWYMEAKCVDSGGSNQFYFGVGKDINSWSFNSSLGYEDTGQGWGYYASSGNIINNGSDLSTSGASYTDGDIISMELDLEDNTLDFYKNGVKQGSQVTSLPAGTYHFVINGYAAIDGEFNFGSPNFSISSGNSDGNGYGNFEYSVPSGHYALNTKNLAEYG